MTASKKYWKGIAEIENEALTQELGQKEFVKEIPVDEFLGDKENLEAEGTSRRDFLKYIGFSTAAATMAACKGPVVKSIPYVIKPEEINPGEAEYYATTLADGQDFASVLVRVREGRPIRLEPNKMAGAFGSTNARVQAAVLSLYDRYRLQQPEANGKPTTWAELDKAVVAGLEKAQQDGKDIVLMTATQTGPSTIQLIEDFKAKYGSVRHISYDAISSSAAADAFEQAYGLRAVPSYRLDKAKVIVSFGADFLGDWLGGGFEAGYAASRNPKQDQMSYHAQIESNMSLTGANADLRVPVLPSEQTYALINLYNALTGAGLTSKATAADAKVKALAKELKKAGSSAVVLSGSSDKNAQLIALAINQALNSEVMDAQNPVYLRKGNDAEVAQLLADMNAGKVGALIASDVNPLYTLSSAAQFEAALKKVALKVLAAERKDESAPAFDYLAPVSNWLESWSDAHPVNGVYTLGQPAIRNLFDTRQLEQNLLAWTGKEAEYYPVLRDYWKANVLPLSTGSSWNQALHDGVLLVEETAAVSATDIDVNAAASAAAKNIKTGGIELALYSKTAMGAGKQANNPWLQEMPDPITRTSWDNYLTISKKQADELGLINENVANGALNGSKADITVNGVTINAVPVYIQPGQAYGSVGLAFGYGRNAEGLKEEMMTGVNAFAFYKDANTHQANVSIAKSAEGIHEFACVQLHNTMMGREDIVRETNFDVYKAKDRSVWNPEVALETHKGMQSVSKIDLWEGHDRSIGHHFNLSIDLNACTGCGSCVIACHAENNVPVVGKEEIRRSRDMHWLRIDRYYSSDMTAEKADEEGLFATTKYELMEDPAANPDVVFQPVMCQHCNHAPCETVCPVAATSHGKEGQNHMAYNRCVGTRYCANNCPYKVRRFNWFQYSGNEEFDYNMNDDLGRMVLNPDVTVRSRGVMEKCSMCIQITQAGKLRAKKEGRKISDDDVRVACASACPSGAMIFGDINDENSEIQEPNNDDRKYYLLEAIGVKPNVQYQTKVRNKKTI